MHTITKSYYFITILILLFDSCNKVCINTQDNKIKGKLKEYVSYLNTTDSSLNAARMLFIYDSITGNLDSIALVAKLNGNYIDTFGSIIFNTLDSNRLTLTYKDIIHFSPEKYMIYHTGKKINKISIVDISGNESIIIKNYWSIAANDSISDVGNFPSSGILLSNFIFLNENCTQYKSSWIDLYFSPTVQKHNTDTIQYSSNINNNVLPNQLIGNVGFDYYSVFSNLSKIIYYLSIDGYYIIKPNKNLIQRIYSGSNYYSFSYEFSSSNRVEKFLIERNANKSVIDLTYY
jgi:hypothetical protein